MPPDWPRPRKEGRPLRVAYVRRNFPKNSETFIVEEIVRLREAGHEVRIYACECELTAMPAKVLGTGLLSAVVFAPWPRPLGRRLGGLVASAAKIAANPGRRRLFAADFFPGRPLKAEFVSSWLKARAGRPAVSGWLRRGRDLVGLAGLSLRIGNCSLALAQYVEARREFRPDVIHCPFWSQWDARTAGWLLERFPGTPYSATLRARDLHRADGSGTWSPVQRRLLEGAAALATISEFNRTRLRELFPARNDIPVFHSAIDPAFFSPRGGGGRRENQVVAVARLVEKKGLEFLVEALALLRRDGIDCVCRLIGDGPLRGGLLRRAHALGLEGRLSIEGPCTQEQVRDALAQSAAFVLPCVVASDGDRDILPNSLKEAMAMELPVVTSAVSGIEELITDGRDGLLAPPRDAAALAQRLARLLGDAGLRARLGRAARDRILRDFDGEIEGARFSEFLRRTADPGRNEPAA